MDQQLDDMANDDFDNLFDEDNGIDMSEASME